MIYHSFITSKINVTQKVTRKKVAEFDYNRKYFQNQGR